MDAVLPHVTSRSHDAEELAFPEDGLPSPPTMGALRRWPLGAGLVMLCALATEDGVGASQIPARDEDIIASTRQWISRVVVGHQLCPFAAAVEGPPSRFVVCRHAPESQDFDALLADELRLLHSLPLTEPATSFLLLAHGDMKDDFAAFMRRAAPRAEATAECITSGDVQVVLFHPASSWGDGAYEDPADYSTRSPWPMLHLLRRHDVDMAEADWVARHAAKGYVPSIQEANAAYLRGLGLQGARRLLYSCRR